MSLRTPPSSNVGPLRNKVSANLADDELAVLDELRWKHVPPISQGGMLRVAWLEWSLGQGHVVAANEPAIKKFVKKGAK